MKKRRLLTRILLVTLLTALFCSSSLFTVVAEISQPTEITVSDFNTTAWEQKNVSAISSDIAFTSESNYCETTVSSVDSYTGSYSIEFAGGKTSGNDVGGIQMIVALGANEANSRIPINPTASRWNVPAGDDTIYLGFGGTTIYIFDRDLDKYQSLPSGEAALGTPLWRQVYAFTYTWGKAFSQMRFKLSVVSGETTDSIQVSCEGSDVVRATINLPTKGLADGYVKISQAFNNKYSLGGVSYNGICNFNVKDLKVNGELLQKSELLVLGRQDLVNIIETHETTSVKLEDSKFESQYLISNFTIDDSAVNDDEKVFTLQYSGQRLSTDNTTSYWGFVLGIDSFSGDLSTGTAIKYNRACDFVGSSTNGVAHNYHATQNPSALMTFTYTVTGYKGGRVEIYYLCNRPDRCTGDTVVYENVDFNGKVAFRLFNDSGLEGGYWNLNGINFNGYAKYAEFYTLTTIVDGQTTTQTLESGSTPTITAPTKEGYEFKGWLYSDSDETEVSKPVDFTIASLEEDVTIKAVFEKTCNLAVVVDGVTTNKTCSVGGTISDIEPQVKAGQVFIGWKFIEGSNAPVYKHGDTTSITLNQDASLEALFVDVKVLGAQIKTYGKQGLRFVTEISTESKAMLDELGVDVSFGTDVTNDTLGRLDIPCVNWFDENSFTAVLTGFDKNDVYLTYEFAAKAYVKVDGVKYHTEEKTRSIYSVAVDAADDYKTQEDGEYIYEINGKFYRYEYTTAELNYIQNIINKCGD